MKTQLLALGAAGLLFAASAAQALPGTQAYAERVNARAEAMLRDAGLATPRQAVSVRADVSLDGHLTGLRVTRSSGSRETDRAIAEVLGKIVAADAPVGLLNGAVTLNVGRDTLIDIAGR